MSETPIIEDNFGGMIDEEIDNTIMTGAGDLPPVSAKTIRQNHPDNIYVKSTYTEKVALRPEEQDENIDRVLLMKIRDKNENRCIHDGFVRPGSSHIIAKSMGVIEDAAFSGNLIFLVGV
jgi:hypothetical protein